MINNPIGNIAYKTNSNNALGKTNRIIYRSGDKKTLLISSNLEQESTIDFT
jgi:hypothetical protein